MEIHKPKPWRGVREFLREYVIVFVGVLTALAAEQGVEQLHWRHAVREAREALHGEIANQVVYFRSRAKIADCMDRHIAQVDALIAQSARDGRKPDAANVAVRIGWRIGTSEWSSEVAAQSLVHFPPAERAKLSDFYDTTAGLTRWRDEESQLWDHLAVLDGPARRIDQAEIAALRDYNIRAKHVADLYRSNVALQLETARALGVESSDATVTDIIGACRDVRIGAGA